MNTYYKISWKKGPEKRGDLTYSYPTPEEAEKAFKNFADVAQADEEYWITQYVTETTETKVKDLVNPKRPSVRYAFQGFGKTNGFFTIDSFPTLGDARAFVANYPKYPGGTYRIVEITTKVIG